MPTRPASRPRLRASVASRAARTALLVVAVGVALTPLRAAAQRDSVRVDTLPRSDTIAGPTRIGSTAPRPRPPLSPRRAFLYSLAVPGLGQSRLDRPNGGALFAAIELSALFMAAKAANELAIARRHARDSVALGYRTMTDSITGFPVAQRDSLGRLVPTGFARNRYAPRIRSRRTQYEDWIAVLLFNHLFAGADAYVAANLWDMPVRASLRPQGARGAVLSARVDFGGAR